MSDPSLSYVICTAPRTGSSLLCAALWRTGVAGRPAEYFDIHERNEVHWRKQLAIHDDGEYLAKVLNAGMTPNGVFGLKLHLHQAPALIGKLRAERAARGQRDASLSGDQIDIVHPLLRERLGETRYVWLRRKNKVAQAISYYRAGKTDQWRVPAAGEAPAPMPVEYDHDAIHKLVLDVQRFDLAWYQFFMRQRLRALIVIYEDFIADYEKTVRGVLDYLDQKDPVLPVAPPQYRRQADENSAEWEQRYHEQLARSVNTPRFSPNRKRRAKRTAGAKAPNDGSLEKLPLIAYDLRSGIGMALEPAPPNRQWMDETPKRFAYRCLPLLIANQFGWVIRNPRRLTAIWDGSVGTNGLRVVYDDPPPRPYATSHFGSGVLTFNVGWLFRTPPGYNLHVRGPVNSPKDGITALDGIVETDWSRATFTMNWKLTRPNHPIVFEAGEPIAMVSPLARHDIERFQPEIQAIGGDPELEADYQAWSRSRSEFNAALKAGDPEAVAAGWQRHYVLGLTIAEADAPEHQTALSLAPFVDKRPREE